MMLAFMAEESGIVKGIYSQTFAILRAKNPQIRDAEALKVLALIINIIFIIISLYSEIKVISREYSE